MPDQPATCSSPQCGAPIVFALIYGASQRGKPSKMPLDPEPNSEGNVAAFRDVNKQLVGRVLVGEQQPLRHETRYMSHFATCEAPAEHRRRAPARPAPSPQQELAP